MWYAVSHRLLQFSLKGLLTFYENGESVSFQFLDKLKIKHFAFKGFALGRAISFYPRQFPVVATHPLARRYRGSLPRPRSQENLQAVSAVCAQLILAKYLFFNLTYIII
jgi:hypothetical protein